jgi:hypothetical protein
MSLAARFSRGSANGTVRQRFSWLVQHKGVSVDSIFPGGSSSSVSGLIKPRVLILILPGRFRDGAAQEHVKQIAKANT